MFGWFKKSNKIRVGDIVSYDWRGVTEVERVISISNSEEYEYPTEKSRLLDEPVMVVKPMATIYRSRVNNIPFRLSLDYLHKMTDEELLLWKLENA